MDLTLRDILEQLYEDAYWAGESRTATSQRHANSKVRKEAAINRAAELIEPLVVAVLYARDQEVEG